MREDDTVARVLRRAFAVLVLLIVVSGSAGVTTVITEHNAVQQLTDHVLPLQLANADLRGVLADGQRGLRGYLLTGDTKLLDNYHTARSDYLATAQRMRRLAVDTENASIDGQVTRAERWWSIAEQQRLAAPRSEQAARYVSEGRRLFAAFEKANGELDDELGAQADRLRERSSVLGVVATIGLITVTGLAVLIGAITAVRCTRRITTPLDRLAEVIGRLRSGDSGARADIGDGPAEIRAVAGAVNEMADDADRARLQEADVARLRQRVRVVNTRVRQYLSVETAMHEAADGLGTTLNARHALVRMAANGHDGRATACFSADGAGDALSPFAEAGTGWLTSGDIIVAAAAADMAAAPESERLAWQAAGGGPLVTVAVSNGEELLGAVTLVRAPGEPAWNPIEVRLVESVATDLGRGVHQARLFEQEQHLVAQLKELDTAKTDFMSTVSHELRTPLTSIAGYVEMLRDGDAGAINTSQTKMLEVIDRNTTRLRMLIEDMLILSRIEAGTFRVQRRTVDLAKLVEVAVAGAGAAAEKAAVTVAVEVARPLPVYADSDQLDRVVTNVISNAVKFTPPGGRVTVSGRAESGEVVLVVSDTGMGIPDADKPRVFARFFRAGNAVHQAIPGTGLGLAIAQTIVQNHDGSIEVDSTESVGTTVTVRLPVADES